MQSFCLQFPTDHTNVTNNPKHRSSLASKIVVKSTGETNRYV